MSRNTMNNQASEGSGVFEPLSESGFAMPSPLDASNRLDSSRLDPRRLDPRLGEPRNGEAELRRLMRARLNAYFDGEGQRDRVAAREALHDLSQLPGGSDELAAMRRVLGAFDARPEHPDLTRVVLAKVAKRGKFLSKPARRRVSAARVLIAASLLVVVGTFVYIDRSSTAPVQGPSGAISAVVEAQRSDAAESVRNLARAVDTLRSDLMEPVGALNASDSSVGKRAPQRSLAMGDTSGYEESTNSGGEGSFAVSLPMTRLFAPARAGLDDASYAANLAGASAPSQTAMAQTLASVNEAWSVGPLLNVAPDHELRLASSNDARITDSIPPLRLDLSDFSGGGSIDDTLTHGGLLARTSADVLSEPEIRLRPDGSRTILWWVFPNASVSPK